MPGRRGVVSERVVLGGRPAERHVPRRPGPGAVLLLHGGAFITGSPRSHRAFAARLAEAAGTAVWVPDYRLAPEHPHPAALDDAVAAVDELRGPVAVVGDSAGAALALLLARRREVAALGLVCPFVDLTVETAAGYDGDDALLRASWLRAGARAYAADVSPLADLGGLPPVLVQVSEHDRLRPEGERLVERLTAAGTPAELQLLPGLWHDAHVLAHLVPDAARAVDDLGHWLRGQTGIPA